MGVRTADYEVIRNAEKLKLPKQKLKKKLKN